MKVGFKFLEFNILKISFFHKILNKNGKHDLMKDKKNWKKTFND